jgi:hypothetical protein
MICESRVGVFLDAERKKEVAGLKNYNAIMIKLPLLRIF